MNRTKVLIGIGFLIIANIILIANNSEFINVFNRDVEDRSERDSDLVMPPRLAAAAHYQLDLNITWGRGGNNNGFNIRLDDLENIYMVGSSTTPTTFWDAFAAKYDNMGHYLLNITWVTHNDDRGRDIAINNSGDIYITGETGIWGTFTSYDAYIAKFNSTGHSQLNITWGDGNYRDLAYGIALDDSGNIYIVGDTQSIGAGSYDAFVAKFNSTGQNVLNITWGGNNADYGRDIVLDDLGNIYITGFTNSFGGGTPGESNAFVAKFNSTGHSKLNITWVSENQDDNGYGIALDGSGNIYITGETEKSGSLYDAFIAKFNSTGHSLLNITWGGDTQDYGREIAVDSSENIYITGVTNSFGAGFQDAFIAKFSSTGQSLTNITYGGSTDEDYGYGIALDNSGNIYITGASYSFDHTAFIAKYRLIHYPGYILFGDDDDDDEAEINILLIGIIIGCISAGVVVVIIAIYIKKRER